MLQKFTQIKLTFVITYRVLYQNHCTLNLKKKSSTNHYFSFLFICVIFVSFPNFLDNVFVDFKHLFMLFLSVSKDYLRIDYPT
jgi:hypothetical protein